MNKPPLPLPPVELLQQFASKLPAPPAWLRAELHNRLVLLLNHVLQQEPQAMDRLRRQQGKRLQLSWGSIELVLQPTPAGLLALSEPGAQSDLQLRVAEASPLALAQQLLAGAKPPVEIQGDVQLAAEVAWLVDNLRWDLEEDLSRLLGDPVAHQLAAAGRTLVQGLRGFLLQLAERRKAAP